ncbi:MAG: DUF3131 domain-containing protein [Rhodobacteraceae bacterium]|nr:DUF3131 domain-containing protein [Paracoccaceae bacterium]
MPNTRSMARLRPSLLFSIGLLIAATTAVWLDAASANFQRSASDPVWTEHSSPLALKDAAALNLADQMAAREAWAYIIQNTRKETGLVDSVAGFPSTTLWDQSSYILGAISAHRLGLVSRDEFDARMSRVIAAFSEMPLFQGVLPNKAYNTLTLEMVDYTNVADKNGIGWSAIDMGRLLLALRILQGYAPDLSADIANLAKSWNINSLSHMGELQGTRVESGETYFQQEGRLGYEQYAARGIALWGVDVSLAMAPDARLAWRDVSGVSVPEDRRSHLELDAITPILSDPFILLALELGLDQKTATLASQVYRAQEARYLSTGTLTMVSEDHIDQPPHFLYSAVLGNDREWAVLTEDGQHHPYLRTVSTKAVFGWDALFGTEYTTMLRSEIETLSQSDQGWFAGRYEKTGAPNTALTLNTNGIILEALHFKKFGPLWQSF